MIQEDADVAAKTKAKTKYLHQGSHMLKSCKSHAAQRHASQTSGMIQEDAAEDDADAGEITDASVAADVSTMRLCELARARDLVGVEQLAKEMRDAGKKPTVACYGVIIDAFAKAGDSVGAERWVEDFTEECLRNKPNTVSVY